MSLKVILTWAGVALLIWWIIQQPASATHLVHGIGSLIQSAVNAVSHFVSAI